MLNPDFLKVAKSNSKIYPDRDSVKVDIVGSDNIVFEDEILKEEVELALYLKCVIYPKLTGQAKTKLLKLIEEFGDMRYFDGSFDATYEG